MKKNQVNSFFIEDTKRHNTIISFITVIVITFVISFAFFIIFINKNKNQYVKYEEKSDVLYNVYLKDNTFYKSKTLDKNNQYISELIDYIKANFKYDLSLEKENVEYNYSYRIEANVTVNDKVTGRSLYKYDDILVPNKELKSKSKLLSINEELDIDYNKYNDLITKFIKTYQLNQTENILKVNLYVNVNGNCDSFSNDTNNSSITSLEIPLTNRTVAIDITNNLVNSNENIIICNKKSNLNYIFIVFSIILLIIDVVLFIKMLIYIKETRSPKTVYKKELKKILNNYRSYIQKINSRFDLRGYQALKVDNFTDMLEIRDTTSQPILMVENNEKDSVFFIIPTSTKILYIYNIKVSNYKKVLEAKDII